MKISCTVAMNVATESVNGILENFLTRSLFLCSSSWTSSEKVVEALIFGTTSAMTGFTAVAMAETIVAGVGGVTAVGEADCGGGDGGDGGVSICVVAGSAILISVSCSSRGGTSKTLEVKETTPCMVFVPVSRSFANMGNGVAPSRLVFFVY